MKRLLFFNSRKALLGVVLLAMLLSLFACTGNAVSPAPTPGESQIIPGKSEPVSSETLSKPSAAEHLRVTVVVDCASVLNNPDTKQTAKDIVDTLIARGYCHEDGILFEDTLMLEPGVTAFNALLLTNLAVGYRTSGLGPYIHAISGLGERDGGKTSGWVYLVNDESPNASSGTYKLSDGDVVRWRYSVEKDDTLKDLP